MSSIGIGMKTLGEPLRLTPFEHWVGHVPFAFWLISALRPRMLVELGTHRGNSYLAFCQAIEAEGCGTRAYAVDTWEGDTHIAQEEEIYEELSRYHDPRYSHFSSLVRSTSQEARELFTNGSIDLLHIDGDHTYESVMQDFLTWESALSDRAVVLFHNTSVRSPQYGVWKVWSELSKDKPNFEFFHSCGLGVLGVGLNLPGPIKHLLALESEEATAVNVRSYFANRGADSVNELLRASLARTEAELANATANQIQSEDLARALEKLDASQQLVTTMRYRLEAITSLTRRMLRAKDKCIHSLYLAQELKLRNIEQRVLVEEMLRSAATANVSSPIEEEAEKPIGARRALEIAFKARAMRMIARARRIFGRADLTQITVDLTIALPQSQIEANKVRSSGLFDEAYYLERNPDVAASGADPADHFARVGWQEGRWPNAAFDPLSYLVHNPDVAQFGGNPLLHYAEHGIAEGRETGLPAVNSVTDDEALSLLDQGQFSTEQQNIIRAVEATGLFDPVYYAKEYPDVLKAEIPPLHHYALTGWREGRNPNIHFSTSAYLNLNSDVAEADVNPLLHFANEGFQEGRPFSSTIQAEATRGSILQEALGRLQLLQKPASLNEKQETTKRWPVKLPDLFNLRNHRPKGRIAVTAHVFYPDLWDEIKEAIQRIPESFDLFVSLVENQSAHMLDRIIAEFPDAYVYVFPNRGRDILPFMCLATTGALAKYEYICKLHTKRSPHRKDGDHWRRHLISAVLRDRGRIGELIAAFDTDPDLGIIVADGQIFQKEETWASNVAHLQNIAPLLGYNVADMATLPFAGGSMFWMRAILLSDLLGLRLEPEAYEPEPIGIDGSLPHAVERLFSVVCHSAGMRVEQASQVVSTTASRAVEMSKVSLRLPRVVAFYLPQFHPIEENDQWWGRGFTEWTNVTKAQPLFPGHRQPRLPGELGFTDLRLPEVRKAQADLARQHGVTAFCYYHYWFGDGKKLLHRPLDEVLASNEPDFPFMICWANEPWSRNWDGANKEVLVPQNYEDGWVQAFAREVEPILKDSRYLKLDGDEGLPVLLIYRIMHVPHPAAAMSALRVALRELGVGEVHLSAGWLALGNDAAVPKDPKMLGLDSYFEFPPHHLQPVPIPSEEMPSGVTGGIYDYAATVNSALERLSTDGDDGNRHRSVMMGWDNTARRGSAAHVFRGATPAHFRRWLRGVVQKEAQRKVGSEERLIFVNAWNEWAEGTCLEPDRDFARGWLEAVRSALTQKADLPPHSVNTEQAHDSNF